VVVGPQIAALLVVRQVPAAGRADGAALGGDHRLVRIKRVDLVVLLEV
jgi:hypothetical protein